jgi:hypothetical protein
MIDARIFFLILPAMLYIRPITMILIGVCVVIMFYFERWRDMDVYSSLRLIRSWFAGNNRPGKRFLKRRQRVDYQRRSR